MEQTDAFVQALRGAGYAVTGELGRGGMGLVLAADQVSLGRRVALKILLDDANGDGEIRRRLAREAAVLQRLTHPNVVRLFDSIEVDGKLVLVFEYIDGGRTIDDLWTGAVKAPAVLAEQILRGLAHVHASGVLHRDLKPSNVLVAEDGTPKITDFGLARDVSVDETRQTRAGAVIGTLSYMPPEQLQGTDVKASADVYAWALIAYELFAGRTVFAAPAGDVPAHQRLAGNIPSIRSLASSVDPRIASFIMRCLSTDPARRPADGASALEEWTRILGSGRRMAAPVVASPAQSASSGRAASVLAMCIAFCAGGLAGAVGVRRNVNDAPARSVASPAAPSIRLEPEGDRVLVRAVVSPAAAATLRFDDRIGSHERTSATSTSHQFALRTGMLDECRHAELRVEGVGAVPLYPAAERLIQEFAGGVKGIDLRDCVSRAFRVAGAALPIERREEMQHAMFPPAVLERLRRARPFIPSLLSGPRSAEQSAVSARVADLELLEAVLDRCGIDAPLRSADLWPRSWSARSNRHLPGRGWLQRYRAGPPDAEWKMIADRSGTPRKAGLGRDAGMRIVYFVALGLTGAAGDSGLKLVTLPLELPHDRDPPPVRVALDLVDLPRSAVWVAINDADSLPLCGPPGFQSSPKDTQREHSRILPPSLLRRGRNDVTIEVRAFPGLSDKTPAYVNGVLFAWPE